MEEADMNQDIPVEKPNEADEMGVGTTIGSPMLTPNSNEDSSDSQDIFPVPKSVNYPKGTSGNLSDTVTKEKGRTTKISPTIMAVTELVRKAMNINNYEIFFMGPSKRVHEHFGLMIKKCDFFQHVTRIYSSQSYQVQILQKQTDIAPCPEAKELYSQHQYQSIELENEFCLLRCQLGQYRSLMEELLCQQKLVNYDYRVFLSQIKNQEDFQWEDLKAAARALPDIKERVEHRKKLIWKNLKKVFKKIKTTLAENVRLVLEAGMYHFKQCEDMRLSMKKNIKSYLEKNKTSHGSNEDSSAIERFVTIKANVLDCFEKKCNAHFSKSDIFFENLIKETKSACTKLKILLSNCEDTCDLYLKLSVPPPVSPPIVPKNLGDTAFADSPPRMLLFSWVDFDDDYIFKIANICDRDISTRFYKVHIIGDRVDYKFPLPTVLIESNTEVTFHCSDYGGPVNQFHVIAPRFRKLYIRLVSDEVLISLINQYNNTVDALYTDKVGNPLRHTFMLPLDPEPKNIDEKIKLLNEQQPKLVDFVEAKLAFGCISDKFKRLIP